MYIRQFIKYLFICFCLFNNSHAISQSSTRNKFFEADYALQLNDYETALKLFKQLLVVGLFPGLLNGCDLFQEKYKLKDLG